jgi:hypothetical protein
MANRPKTSSGPSNSDTLQAILGKLAELTGLVGEISARLSAQAGGDLDPGRRHDPGDAVPPGVAPAEAAPLTPEDKKARRALERMKRPRAAGEKG